MIEALEDRLRVSLSTSRKYSLAPSHRYLTEVKSARRKPISTSGFGLSALEGLVQGVGYSKVKDMELEAAAIKTGVIVKGFKN